MIKSKFIIASTLLFALLGAACSSPDNVGACESLAESLSCGSSDVGQYLTCSSFEKYDCDIVDYFDCLEDNSSCEQGVADYTGWAACTSKLNCD